MRNYWKYLQNRLIKAAKERFGRDNYINALAALTGRERGDIVNVMRGDGSNAKRSAIKDIARELGYIVVERISKDTHSGE